MNVASITSGAELASITIPQLLEARVSSRPDAIAFRQKRGGEWISVSWLEYATKACRLARALQSTGLQRGDRVAIMGDASQEWLLADMATICAGGATVGVYFTSSIAEVEYCLSDSGANFIFVGDEAQLRTVLCTGHAKTLTQIIVLDPAWTGALRAKNVLSLNEFYGGVEVECHEYLRNEISLARPDHLASIGYTSGTTGFPKGAMLSHLSLLAGAHVVTKFCPVVLTEPQRLVVHLPMSHTVARAQATTMPLLAEMVPHFGETTAAFAQTIREVRPTYYMAPPRFYQRFATQLLSDIQSADKQQRKNYLLAMRIARKALDDRRNGRVPNQYLNDLFRACHKHVFAPLLEQVGFDELSNAFTSSAPMPSEVMTLWQLWGLNLKECYGQTEMVGGNLVQMVDWPKAGNVGHPVPDRAWETTVLEDGEMIVRGPGLFTGYWNKPEETNAALRHGWLYTGDIVEVGRDGVYKLVDRKKEIINTSGGKSISPTQIENEIRQSPYISEAAVIGDGKKYLTALIELDATAAMDWAKLHDKDVKSYSDLCKSEPVIRMVEGEIEKANGRLARAEQIKDFRILYEELSPENGVMTPTRKKRRKQIMERYRGLIDTLYDESEENLIKAQVGR
jgi:long-chain acyl-CoA synthetase